MQTCFLQWEQRQGFELCSCLRPERHRIGPDRRTRFERRFGGTRDRSCGDAARPEPRIDAGAGLSTSADDENRTLRHDLNLYDFPSPWRDRPPWLLFWVSDKFRASPRPTGFYLVARKRATISGSSGSTGMV